MRVVVRRVVIRPLRYSVYHCARAFTIVELFVTIITLALLASIVLPYFPLATRVSRSVICKNNLHNLAALLHTDNGESLGLAGSTASTVPGASRWTDFVADNSLQRLMLCPSDDTPRDILTGLRHVYVRQDGGVNTTQAGVKHSDLADLLAGRNVPDKQLYYNFRGQTNGSCISRLKEDVPGVPGAWRMVRKRVGWQWVYDLNGGPPDDNQALVAIDTCAAFAITFTGPWIEIRPLGRHPQWSSGSRHWVCKGSPDDADGWEADVLVRLTGVAYDIVNPPVRIYAGQTSYGMSNLVGIRNFHLGDIWLLEYTHAIADLTPETGDRPFDSDPTNGEVLARHNGQANVMTVGGAVSSLSPQQLAGPAMLAVGE